MTVYHAGQSPITGGKAAGRHVAERLADSCRHIASRASGARLADDVDEAHAVSFWS
jgi:hypothetical protein